MKEHLQKLLRNGCIVESQSDHASAVVLVRKRSGALRLGCDYRALNAKTIKDAHPLPRIDESMDAMKGARWFSTLDLQSAYNQVRMHPDDQHKTAFTTPFGLYEFARMPFGLCNAPVTFQRLMQTAFRNELFTILLCYLDDIIIFAEHISEHIRRLDVVFTKLAEYGLKLDLKKCSFFRDEVNYLGHRVSAEGIATDPSKITDVTNWSTPSTLKELRSFLGFASYYRRYVSRFTQIANPLHQLVTSMCQEMKGKARKSTHVKLGDQWTKDCDSAFNTLKHTLTTAPILGFADYTQPFVVETDACDRGLGAVLSQVQEGRLRIIAYASRGLRGAERNATNYSSKKLELLALKWAVTEKFRDYLLGSKFTIYTDNPLTYLMKKTKLPALEQRWTSALAPFDFNIQYRAARHNANADALSRMTHQTVPMDDDDVSSCFEEVTRSTALPATLRANLVESAVHCIQQPAVHTATCYSNMTGSALPSTGTLPSIPPSQMSELQQKDPTIGRLRWFRALNRRPDRAERLAESTKTLTLLKQWDRIVEKDHVLFRRIVTTQGDTLDQLLLPECLQERVLKGVHDDAGHQGVERTDQLARNRCYWPNMQAAVKQWVEKCARCTVAKMPHTSWAADGNTTT